MKRSTGRARVAALVATGLLAVAAGGPAASAASTTAVKGNVPGWLSSAKLKGKANGNGTMHVSVYLRLRQQSALSSLLHDLYAPGSARYHRFLTPAQFHSQFAATPATVADVKAWLKASGLRVTAAPASHLYVDAVGSVAQVEKTFGVQENLYRFKGHTLRATPNAPRVPTSLAAKVRYVGGLDDTSKLYVPAIKRDTTGPKASPGLGYSTPGPCSTYWGDHSANVDPAANQYGSHLPWTPCGYTPAQIRAAYGVDDASQTGKGVTVGITDAFASPTIVDDVNMFSDTFDLPQLVEGKNFTQIVHPGTYHVGESIMDPQGWYGEQSLDIEWVHAIAPDAHIVYAGANNSNTPLDHALEDMIDANQVDIVTNSWGINGEYTAPGHVFSLEAAIEQAAAQGISVLFSSGDDGDVEAITGLAQGSWPATSPYATAVGGTSLGVLDASGAKREWGWGTALTTLDGSVDQTGANVTGDSWDPWPPELLYGAGGGVSVHFAQPDYQQGVVPDDLAGTFGSAHRVVPDISMDGDPNTGALYGQTYDVSGDPLIDAGCPQLPGNREYCLRRIGGTSLSSPLFAGVLALVNQARGDRIGFANPALYAVGTGTAIQDVQAPARPTAVLRNVQAFDDAGNSFLQTTLRTINSLPEGTSGPVIEGWDTSLRTGDDWDDVTGLGTPNVPQLISKLK